MFILSQNHATEKRVDIMISLTIRAGMFGKLFDSLGSRGGGVGVIRNREPMILDMRTFSKVFSKNLPQLLQVVNFILDLLAIYNIMKRVLQYL